MGDPGNVAIAAKLHEMADLLAAQEEDGFRIAAYRRAAVTLETLDTSVAELRQEGGLDRLIELRGIGHGIAAAIAEMLDTGRWSQLERLEGALEPARLFQTLPGIGPVLAAKIHDELHADTLEQLEQAAHDGRLADVPGIGERRAAAIRATLSERLGRARVRRGQPLHLPPVAVLLDVDAEYRAKAEDGSLRRIAPKRFNPDGEAWLPILHTRRGDWQFTVLFSNTARAHDLAKTTDWVVIYDHWRDEPESQSTVVTETRGPLAGRRVVRGREGDCIAYYADVEAGADAKAGRHAQT